MTMTLLQMADDLSAIIEGERPRLNKTEMRDYVHSLHVANAARFAANDTPDGYAKPAEITRYRCTAADTLAVPSGGIAVFLSDKLDRTYTVPVYFGVAATQEAQRNG